MHNCIYSITFISFLTPKFDSSFGIRLGFSTRFRFDSNHSAVAVIKSVLLMIQLNEKNSKHGCGTLIKLCQQRVKYRHSLAVFRVGLQAN